MKKPGVWVNLINGRLLVFTPVGCIVLFFTLFILIRSLITRNVYEIVLASGFLFLLLILGITGFWKSRKLKTMNPAWKPPFPFTAQFGQYGKLNIFGAVGSLQKETCITGLESSIPLFFRFHYFIHGRFFPGGCSNSEQPAGNNKKKFSDSCSFFAGTSVPRGDTSAELLLDFPMSGTFNGDGFCLLRDIFGFFSFSCGLSQSNTVNIRSAPCFGKKIHINAQAGAEDRRNKPSADEERYYMREYTPGDRLRDINWKSSDRIDTLITRISTDNQERINRIDVYFRNYCLVNSFEALWLLDRAKARLTYFLRSLMEQNSSFIFDVRTAQGSWEIANLDELDNFLEELSGLSFSPLKNESVIDMQKKTGELYVFSTACDAGLPGFLLTCNPRPVTLFISQPQINKTESAGDNSETEILHIKSFIQNGLTPSPGWFRKTVKPLAVNTNKIEINYTEIKL